MQRQVQKKFSTLQKYKKKLRKTCQGIQKDIIIKYNMPSLHSNSINTLNSQFHKTVIVFLIAGSTSLHIQNYGQERQNFILERTLGQNLLIVQAAFASSGTTIALSQVSKKAVKTTKPEWNRNRKIQKTHGTQQLSKNTRSTPLEKSHSKFLHYKEQLHGSKRQMSRQAKLSLDKMTRNLPHTSKVLLLFNTVLAPRNRKFTKR